MTLGRHHSPDIPSDWDAMQDPVRSQRPTLPGPVRRRARRTERSDSTERRVQVRTANSASRTRSFTPVRVNKLAM
jgi:hypothetical protein